MDADLSPPGCRANDKEVSRADGHKPAGPAVVIQRVRVADEAVRLFLKAGELAGSVNAFLSAFGRAVDTDDLEVVVSLVEVQLTVNISVLEVRPVELASMTNIGNGCTSARRWRLP